MHRGPSPAAQSAEPGNDLPKARASTAASSADMEATFETMKAQAEHTSQTTKASTTATSSNEKEASVEEQWEHATKIVRDALRKDDMEDVPTPEKGAATMRRSTLSANRLHETLTPVAERLAAQDARRAQRTMVEHAKMTDIIEQAIDAGNQMNPR